jgi:hypothetical protein
VRSFLLVYDRSSGRLLDLVEYSEHEGDRALEDRFAREREERHNPDIEVVVLNAESVDALKRTHGRYFFTVQELAARLGG